MLTQRYALYIMLVGITLILIAVAAAILAGLSLLVALIGFYGLLSTFGGYWMWERGRNAV